MSSSPVDAYASAGEAFAHVNAQTHPSIDDLKLMVYLEASGQSSYEQLAKTAPNDGIRRLLEANGREEMAHAHRVSKVIKILSGEDFPPPEASANPYVSATGRTADRRLLESLVRAEIGGGALYDTWAETIGDTDAAALLRQNAKEERSHGDRATQAIALL
jgi:rubrerythrin